MDTLLAKYNQHTTEDAAQNNKDVQIITPIQESTLINNENPFYLPYNNRVYDKQFFKLYQYRLNVLRKRVYDKAYQKWGDQHPYMNKVLDIEYGSVCWSIGAIYCEMKYKPDVLEEVSNDVYGSPDLITKYSDEQNDEIMLEDESGRVLLKNLNKKFVTGTVIGVLGQENDDGDFEVLDVCFPQDLPMNKCATTSTNLSSILSLISPSQEENIAFVSGLNINSENLSSVQLLQDYLIGALSTTPHNISKLYILGDSIKDVENLSNLQNFLLNIVQSVSIQILPGFHDPSDKSLPQQPLNHKLFAQRNLHTYLELTTNPSVSIIQENNMEMLLTSGENLNDIFKYNYITQSRQQMMELTLKCQNIAPTAPDTLFCYPFDDKDPFVLDKWPNVYAIGNQPEFFDFTTTTVGNEKSSTAGIKCIGVPDFSKNQGLVVFNPTTLYTEFVSLS
ncbi:hypothetical protein ACO0QE_001734 [Hanseniaspora vineae]